MEKSSRFILSNDWIIEALITTLRDEQMIEAVESIAGEIYELGIKLDSKRLQAFSLMTLGELASQEYINDADRAEKAIEQLH